MTVGGTLSTAAITAAATTDLPQWIRTSCWVVGGVGLLIALVGGWMTMNHKNGEQAQNKIQNSPEARQANIGTVVGSVYLGDVNNPNRASSPPETEPEDRLLAIAERIRRFVDSHPSTGRCGNRVFQGAFAADFRSEFGSDLRTVARLFDRHTEIQQPMVFEPASTDGEAIDLVNELERLSPLLRRK